MSVHEKVKPESETGSLFSLEKLITKKTGSVSEEPTAEPSLVSPGEAVATPEAREVYHLSFSIASESVKKLERVQSLMSNRGAKSLEAVFSALLETYLDKRCPERRSVPPLRTYTQAPPTKHGVFHSRRMCISAPAAQGLRDLCWIARASAKPVRDSTFTLQASSNSFCSTTKPPNRTKPRTLQEPVFR